MNGVARWRIAVAVIVLGGLVFFTGRFAPIYFRNFKLQSFVSETAHRADSRTQPDNVLSGRVLDRARELELPVKEGDVRIVRSPEGLRINVRYFVRVDVPGYTVNLHFHPSAGSR